MITRQYDRNMIARAEISRFTHRPIWSRIWSPTNMIAPCSGRSKPIWSKNTLFPKTCIWRGEFWGFTLVAQGWFRFCVCTTFIAKCNGTVIFGYLGDQTHGGRKSVRNLTEFSFETTNSAKNSCRKTIEGAGLRVLRLELQGLQLALLVLLVVTSLFRFGHRVALTTAVTGPVNVPDHTLR